MVSDRRMHYTLTALLQATSKWYLNIDDDLINSVLFLDLKKTFVPFTTAYCWTNCNFTALTRMQVVQIIPIKSRLGYLCKWNSIRLSSY